MFLLENYVKLHVKLRNDKVGCETRVMSMSCWAKFLLQVSLNLLLELVLKQG